MTIYTYEVICKVCGLKFTHSKANPRGRLKRYCNKCNVSKRRLPIYTEHTIKEQ